MFVFFGSIKPKKLIWKFDTDISNPENWIDKKVAEGCTGIHFSGSNSAPVYISELTTGEITFPHDGNIILESDGFIEFRDNKKCIKLQPIDFHDWYDPTSWYQTDDNVAIPDKERIPCNVNEAFFPQFPPHNLHMGDMFELVKPVPSESNISYLSIDNPKPCQNPYGCLCHDHFVPCHHNNQEKPKCSSPVIPEESCHEICGAYLTYRPGQGPTIKEVQDKLKEFEVDTHVSRVKDYLGGEVVQVVFSEKEYSGKSLVEAETFREFLQKSKAGGLQLYQSGQPNVGGDHAVAIVFGSLMAVVCFFGILFYINGNPPQITTILSGFNRSRGSIFNTPFFARFDNTDENLIMDGQSESGSILDIAKSFDNPMYGQSPSTTESQHENPLYEVTKDIEE